ncbi:hypothetical protein ES705_50445 [subsurface metagenome]
MILTGVMQQHVTAETFLCSKSTSNSLLKHSNAPFSKPTIIFPEGVTSNARGLEDNFLYKLGVFKLRSVFTIVLFKELVIK